MSFGLGFWAAAGGEAYTGAYEQIATTVFSSNTGSLTFSSLPTGYKHLQIRLTAKHSSTGTGILLNFNGDTGNNYGFHYLLGNGSAVSSFGTGSIGYMVIDAMTSSTTTSAFGAGVIDILDAFSTTKNKTIRSLGGGHNGSNTRIRLDSGFWNNTAAITSITLNAGDFVTGSRLSLYGIKG